MFIHMICIFNHMQVQPTPEINVEECPIKKDAVMCAPRAPKDAVMCAPGAPKDAVMCTPGAPNVESENSNATESSLKVKNLKSQILKSHRR